MAKKTRVIKCDEEFVELVKKTKEKFEEKTGTEISLTQVTKIIANKIKNAGGIKL